MDPGQERLIIQKVLNGHRDAYADIVEKYAKPIYNLTFRLTGSPSDADDLAQETFIRAYEQLQTYDQEKSFFTWLYTISLNVTRNHLKKKNKYKSNPFLSLASIGAAGGVSPEAVILEKERNSVMEFCLGQLPILLKEAIILKYIDHFSFEDLAVILDISVSAAKMRVYRGLQRLKQLIEEAGL